MNLQPLLCVLARFGRWEVPSRSNQLTILADSLEIDLWRSEGVYEDSEQKRAGQPKAPAQAGMQRSEAEEISNRNPETKPKKKGFKTQHQARSSFRKFFSDIIGRCKDIGFPLRVFPRDGQIMSATDADTPLYPWAECWATCAGTSEETSLNPLLSRLV